MSSVTARSICLFFGALALVAFVVNWFWEMAQMRAYTEMASAAWTVTLIPCTWATLGDVVFTFIIYGIGALAAGQISWGMTQRWHVLASAAIMGGMIATAIEWRAQISGRWSYTEAMPVVPMLGVGLWPLLQLTITVPAAFWLAARLAKKGR